MQKILECGSIIVGALTLIVWFSVSVIPRFDNAYKYYKENDDYHSSSFFLKILLICLAAFVVSTYL